ncbi:MAG: CdaR family protein [Limisphaerales bacterium]
MPKRDWVAKDLTWKLFSLILAVALWITIHNLRETPEAADPFATVTAMTYTNLPVLAVSAGADVHNAQIVPNLVAVEISGPSDIMAGLQKGDVHVLMNLTGLDSARLLRRNVDVSVPPGVTLDRVSPTEVSVTILPATE